MRRITAMRFKNNVLPEQRKFLRFQLKEYRKDMVLTNEEVKELEMWVSSGHSPYENPDLVCYEGGFPMDYINAKRFLEEEYLEYLKNK